jgi:hypothetical protein
MHKQRVHKTLHTGPNPNYAAVKRDGSRVYVSSRTSPKFWVLDQQNLALLDEIAIRGEGHEMGVMTR